MAHQHLRRERIGHMARTGTLVQEVCLRLIEASDVECRNREEFFRIAARLMRHVLVDFARKRRAVKRGGSWVKVSLEDAKAFTPALDIDLVALHEALDDLARYDKELDQVVELLYFAGYTTEETAKILGVSTDTVKRRWKKAKIYLLKILTDAEAAMDQQRWKKIDDVFEQILEIELAERAEALAQISTGDDDLRRSVEALLEFEAPAEKFLQSSAIADLAGQVAGELVALTPGQRIGLQMRLNQKY
jgi:RNA polymerase sigma factor (TIGR02999 family)